MASKIIKDALPSHLKPSNGSADAAGRHHGKSQSHVVSKPSFSLSRSIGTAAAMVRAVAAAAAAAVTMDSKLLSPGRGSWRLQEHFSHERGGRTFYKQLSGESVPVSELKKARWLRAASRLKTLYTTSGSATRVCAGDFSACFAPGGHIACHARACVRAQVPRGAL